MAGFKSLLLMLLYLAGPSSPLRLSVFPGGARCLESTSDGTVYISACDERLNEEVEDEVVGEEVQTETSQQWSWVGSGSIRNSLGLCLTVEHATALSDVASVPCPAAGLETSRWVCASGHHLHVATRAHPSASPLYLSLDPEMDSDRVTVLTSGSKGRRWVALGEADLCTAFHRHMKRSSKTPPGSPRAPLDLRGAPGEGAAGDGVEGPPQVDLQKLQWFFRTGDDRGWKIALTAVSLVGFVLGLVILAHNIYSNQKRKQSSLGGVPAAEGEETLLMALPLTSPGTSPHTDPTPENAPSPDSGPPTDNPPSLYNDSTLGCPPAYIATPGYAPNLVGDAPATQGHAPNVTHAPDAPGHAPDAPGHAPNVVGEGAPPLAPVPLHVTPGSSFTLGYVPSHHVAGGGANGGGAGVAVGAAPGHAQPGSPAQPGRRPKDGEILVEWKDGVVTSLYGDASDA